MTRVERLFHALIDYRVVTAENAVQIKEGALHVASELDSVSVSRQSSGEMQAAIAAGVRQVCALS